MIVDSSHVVVSAIELIPTPTDPLYSRVEPCPVFCAILFWHHIRQCSAAINMIFIKQLCNKNKKIKEGIIIFITTKPGHVSIINLDGKFQKSFSRQFF